MALSSRRLLGGGLAALVCAAVLTCPAAPASAHDALKRSSPAKDAQVSSLEEIELEYSASVKFPFVVLHDAAGKQVPLGEPRLEGPKVFAGVPRPLAPGAYVIGWRVVSSDGHPIEGEIPFRVKGAPSPRATPAAEAAPPTDAGGTPAARESAAAGVPGWIWGGLAVLLVLGAFVLLRSSRRKPGEPDAG
ncbi:copper resistance CopC family protein [Nonomuraea aridisoli]|uniref:Copper resistance protein CopC n=1 Tax=Nonomuraea aridisoli TaxID=2070368 RepID=A0A2W2EFM8_9ACTN|nr:copper resistance protein CopC [Nonomuraea aridisoli]PZG15755.1 copper resistance protein CopC [Nonomuraea aridisoli]